MHKDPELGTIIAQVRTGSQKAFADLYTLYTPMIDTLCRGYNSSLLEEDELRQVCAIGLFCAACAFNLDQNEVTFGLYAQICIRNRIITELRKLRPSEVIDENELGDANGLSPEDELIARESYRRLIGQLESLLSEYELRVFRMYFSGKPYAAIAQSVKRSEKSVGTAIARAKTKLRSALR